MDRASLVNSALSSLSTQNTVCLGELSQHMAIVQCITHFGWNCSTPIIPPPNSEILVQNLPSGLCIATSDSCNLRWTQPENQKVKWLFSIETDGCHVPMGRHRRVSAQKSPVMGLPERCKWWHLELVWSNGKPSRYSIVACWDSWTFCVPPKGTLETGGWRGRYR